MLWIAFFLLMHFLLQILRYKLFHGDINVCRYLCIPMMAQPLLILFIALYIHQPKNQPLPRYYCLFIVVGVLLVLGFLTNDLHFLAKSFPSGIMDDNGHGTAPDAQSVENGKTATKPTDPTASGWNFRGWYKEKECKNIFDFSTAITGDITLYAKWTKTGGGGSSDITTQYTLTYNTNGGSAIASTEHDSETTVTLTAKPTREDFVFMGWYSDADLTNKISSIKMDGNKTVYADWKEISHDSPSNKSSNAFKDVNTDMWHYKFVDYVVEKGLMQGVTDDMFAPDITTTRAMIVTVLHRLEGTPSTGGASPFYDVADGQWYTNAVIWANANGIVEGYGNGKFGPNDNITREQLAAIMHRYASFKGYDIAKTADLSVYTDVANISSWAIDSVKWAYANDLLTGRSATMLVPTGNATRAEVATIFMRFIENIK